MPSNHLVAVRPSPLVSTAITPTGIPPQQDGTFHFGKHLCFPFGNYLCRRNCLAATPNTIAHLRGQKKSRTRPDDTRAMRRLRGRDKVQLEKKLFLSDESEGNLLKINCKINIFFFSIVNRFVVGVSAPPLVFSVF